MDQNVSETLRVLSFPWITVKQSVGGVSVLFCLGFFMSELVLWGLTGSVC